MKKSLVTCLLIAGILTGLSAQETVVRMSLQQAIDYALGNQPIYKNFQLDQQIAKAKTFESQTKFIPKANGSFDYRDNLIRSQFTIPAKSFNPTASPDSFIYIPQGTRYNTVTGIDVSQSLLDLGAIKDIKYAKESRQFSGYLAEQARIELKVAVSKAYYNVLLNQEKLVKATASVTRLEQLFKDVNTKFENGNALKSELDKAGLDLSNANYQKNVAAELLRVSNAALAQLIGLGIDRKIEVTDAFMKDIKVNLSGYTSDLKAAEDSRIEMRREAAQKKLNALQLQKIKLQYAPTINAYGYYGAQYLSDRPNIFRSTGWFTNGYIGARVIVPLFDGLTKVAQVQQQKLLLKKNDNNLDSIRQSINYQLINSNASLQNSLTNLELQKENIKLAERLLAEATNKYNNGFVLYQEVLNAQNTLKETETNYFQALYDYLVADIDWKKANGKL